MFVTALVFVGKFLVNVAVVLCLTFVVVMGVMMLDQYS